MTPLKYQTKNPWISIWFSPRETYRELRERENMPLILIFAICSGALSAFSFLWLFWIQYPQKEVYRNFWFITISAIGGIVYGILYLYIGSWLYKVVGRWVKGNGEIKDLRIALGWSFYPSIVSGIIYLIGIILSSTVFLQSIFMLISTALGVWGFIIFLHLIGEAHGFSAWRALLTVLISSLLIFAAFALVAILISLPAII